MSYWEPDDPPELPEGCIDEDVVETLRALLKHVDLPDPFPRPGNRSDAALILIDHELNPPKASTVEDPTIRWAKQLLADLGLY